MKRYSSSLTAVILLACFSSCQQEADGTLNPDIPVNVVLLKSVLHFDTTKASGLDTIYKNDYVFDSQKRLISSNSAEYSYFGTTVTKSTFNYQFMYLGNSIYPFRQVITQDNIAPYHSYLSYNSSNHIIKDSSFWIVTPNTVSIQTCTTTPSGGFMMVWKEKDLTAGTVIDRDSVLYRRVLSNGNILTGVDSSYYATLGLRTRNYEFTYDSKTNPFAALSQFHLLGDLYFTADSYALPYGRNNATSFRETSFDGTNTDLRTGTLSYVYRPDGLPLTAIITGDPGVNKIVFSYY